MEIPFTSKNRPDTGLYNAKVGIWLFLASEVMLFGALFSSYVLLRVGARPGDWPMGLLNNIIGGFNTIVLIVSSWTVVMAWLSLQNKNFRQFKIYQFITFCCALGFIGVKSYEYNEKFQHHEVWMKDGRRVTGHIYIDGSKYFHTLEKIQAMENPPEEIEIHPDATHYGEKYLTILGRESSTPVKKAVHGAASEQVEEGVAGAEGDHSGSEGHGEESHGAGEHHDTIHVKVDDIRRISAFVPAHSTYFAIYFTLTGLHGLHVLGGAVVLFYFWGPGSRMWKTDPQRFTNRIEIGGLFWHFVDLVWIFLFPILYLL